MTDEGLREIQLDGKQLVFLFMAATVVAVVIFLCGVMVGRGVPVRAGSATDGQEVTGLDPTAPSQSSLTHATPAGGGPVATDEVLSYDRLLGSDTSPVETLRPPSEAPAEPPAGESAVSIRPVVSSQPAPTAAAAPRNALASRPIAPTAATARTLNEPRGNGFVVQVAAVPRRDEANSIARRLSGKGYPAFVTTSGSNFRVRVGKYANRREAETVANKLEREERIEPWVTR